MWLRSCNALSPPAINRTLSKTCRVWINPRLLIIDRRIVSIRQHISLIFSIWSVFSRNGHVHRVDYRQETKQIFYILEVTTWPWRSVTCWIYRGIVSYLISGFFSYTKIQFVTFMSCTVWPLSWSAPHIPFYLLSTWFLPDFYLFAAHELHLLLFVRL